MKAKPDANMRTLRPDKCLVVLSLSPGLRPDSLATLPTMTTPPGMASAIFDRPHHGGCISEGRRGPNPQWWSQFTFICLFFVVADNRAMNLDFTANSPDELAHIGCELLNARRQTSLDEQWQMTQFLKVMSLASIFQFPLQVRHTGSRGVPDFQVKSGKRRIAVELAKIAVQDVEHARGLQNKGLKRSSAITSLLRSKSVPRKKTEVIAEAFSIQPFVFGVPHEELNEIWLKQITSQFDEKTAVLHGKQFEHGDEDWLVLWDRIGHESGMQSRIVTVNNLLAPRWNQNWFSRVFVQQIGACPRLAVFARTGSRSIPDHSERPHHNYPAGFIFSGSAEE
jgi:hypothetical protein